MSERITFNRPTIIGNELQYIREAFANRHVSGDGAFTRQCHALLEAATGGGKALLTTSCTHALEMSGILIGLEPGDEVIVPAFTFVSTPNAFLLHKARPVFVDVRADTLNMDEALIEEKIGEKTRAVVPVHYAGVGCAMDEIGEIASRRGIVVIEDNAHGLFGSYKGRPLGSFGAMATQSFHESKNFSSGEGGALIINDPRYADRAEIIREKGTNRSRFFRGEVDKYSWVDVGSSYLASDILAAVLCAQLERAEAVQAKRRAIWERYNRELEDWARERGVRMPHVPAVCGQAWHMFYMICPSLDFRSALIAHLNARDVHAVFHYLPLHISEMGRRLGGRPGDCPVAERISECLVRLPMFFELSDEEQSRVIEAVHAFK